MPPEDSTADTTDTTTTTDASTGDPALEAVGDAGAAAIKAERKRAADAERRAKAAEKERDDLRAAQLSDAEKAVEQARREASEQTRTELLGAVGKRLAESAVRAYATGRVLDVDAAVALVDLDAVTVDPSSFLVDEAAVQKAVDELLKRKPVLAAKRTNGTADGGARGTAVDLATTDALKGVSRMAAAYAAGSTSR
jgi:hypothetical protein